VGGGDGATTITRRDGDLYTLAETSPPRPAGDCETFRIRVVSAETATLADGCPPSGESLLLERVSPRGASAPPLTPRFPVEAAFTVTQPLALEGTWVNQATHQVMAVGQAFADAPVTYLVDDDGDGSVRPDQRGQLTVGADGSVRPEPGTAVGGGCAPDFSKVVSTTATLVTTSGANGCFPAGSTQTWLRLN
jgi:hypothetical protein